MTEQEKREFYLFIDLEIYNGKSMRYETTEHQEYFARSRMETDTAVVRNMIDVLARSVGCLDSRL